MEQQPSPLARILPAARGEVLARQAEAKELFDQLMQEELANYIEARMTLPEDITLEVNPSVLRGLMTRRVDTFGSPYAKLKMRGYVGDHGINSRMTTAMFRKRLTAIVERVLVPGGLTYEWVTVPQERAYSRTQQMHRLRLTWPKAK